MMAKPRDWHSDLGLQKERQKDWRSEKPRANG
jgi:hypothetical protein